MTVSVSPMHRHIIIIGGGLAGWSLFEHLVAAGHEPASLLLIEKGVSGRGASGVIQGMLHPFTGRTLAPKPGAMEAWRYSRQWLQAMQTQSGTSFYTEKPLWRIATDEQTEVQFARSFEKAQQSDPDYPMRTLDHTRPLQNVRAGYVFPEAGHVDVSQLLAYFQRHYADARLLYSTIAALYFQNQNWYVHSDSGTYSAPHVVLAPGHELLDFFPDLPLRTKRGEVITFRSPQAIRSCVSGGGRYLVPLSETADQSTGLFTYVGGATFYRDDAHWPPSQSWKDLCSRFGWFPDIENAEMLRVWSGVRATLHPDRAPLCGPVPEQPGLWLMGAFSTRGLLQIPQHARALANTLSQSQPLAHAQILPEASLPERVPRFKFVKKAGKNVFALHPALHPTRT